MDFLNKYLLHGHVKEINIFKDPRTEVFNYRAKIEMNDGKKFQMVLGSQESFLAKLDMVQRQMGKQPSQFIPVKYVNDNELTFQSAMFTFIIAAMAVAGIYQLVRRGGKLPPPGKKGVPQKKENSSWFNPMSNVGQSTATTYGEDKKIDVRFKDVAGHDNAK